MLLHHFHMFLHHIIARVQPRLIQGDSKVGTELASLEITYLIIDREIRKLAEKKRLDNLVYMEYQSPPV